MRPSVVSYSNGWAYCEFLSSKTLQSESGSMGRTHWCVKDTGAKRHKIHKI